MRGFFLALILAAGPGTGAQAETVPFVPHGWFGLQMFDDMNCANNPVWIDVMPGSDRLDLRWRKSVTYADGTTSDRTAFVITAVTENDLRGTRLTDGMPVLFRFAADMLSFDYLEGEAIDAPIDPDLRATFVRCEFQGS